MTALNDIRDEMADLIADGLSSDLAPGEIAERVSKATVFDDFAESIVQMVRDAQRAAPVEKAAAPPSPEGAAERPVYSEGFIKLPTPIVNVAATDFTPLADAMNAQTSTMKALLDRPNPAPVVNVTVPEVVVPAPIVNYSPPEPAQKATTDGPMDVRVVEMPDRLIKSQKLVQRDGKGLISQVNETTVEETLDD